MRLRVSYRIGAALEQEGTTVDISLGGAFVLARRLPEVGQPLVLQLSTPTAWDPLEIPSHVRWLDDGSRGGAMGFGVRFEGLTRGQATALHELLQSAGYLDEGVA
ncbi:MAG: PilZ domain-containing protein [Myxococcales bacterium]|nr:PilZ domain-containing protein [Myxococcales bacterium]